MCAREKKFGELLSLFFVTKNKLINWSGNEPIES